MIGQVFAWAVLLGCAEYVRRSWTRALVRPPEDAPPVPPATRPPVVEVDAEARWVTPQGVSLPLAHGWSDQDVLVTVAQIEAL